MGDVLLALIFFVQHELMLFAAAGLAIGGLDDFVIDIFYLVRRGWRRINIYSRYPRASTASLPPSDNPGPIAIFIPAWQEADVIGPMLRTALHRWSDADYRLFVGAYPNDAATIRAVGAVAAGDPRVILGINERAGPTTKADCLNILWRILLREEARTGRRFKAVVLHDAEHVVSVVNRLATQSRVGQGYGQTQRGYNSRFRNEARLSLCAL